MPQDPRLADTFSNCETAKYLHLTVPYLVGNGLDIGSGGWPVVPWAIQIEQLVVAFKHYNSGRNVPSGVEWIGDICDLPFKDNSLDWIYSSHLIEDFPRWIANLETNELYPISWPKLFTEWKRVLRPGGLIVLIVPDKELWQAAIDRGQTPNCAHFAPEPSLGDMTKILTACGFTMIEERMTAITPHDFSILGVARKP